MSLGVPGQQIEVKNAISSVDASTILLRLAGKQPVKKGDGSTEQKEKKKGKSKAKDRRKECEVKDVRRNSSRPPGSTASVYTKNEETPYVSTEVDLDNIPDWNGDELDETTLSAFRELFNTLDQSNTGIITAENLYEELRRVDSQISFSEVEDVLKKVDKDGSGTIDFDEFLYHMTAMGGDLFGEGEEEGEVDEEKRKMHSRRKRLFYSAITRFSIRQTLADLEKTFRKQAPHVISHYTAGARLIGLTTRQLERQMKKMQKSAVKNDSPYAKPLQFVHLQMKGQKKVVQRTKIKTIKDKPGSCRDLQARDLSEQEADPAVDNLTKEIQDTMMMFAQKKGSIVPEDANIIMKLRQKLGSVTARIKDKKPTESKGSYDGLSTMPSLNRPKSAILRTNEETPIIQKHKTRSAPAKHSGKQEKQRNFKLAMGWTTPRIQYIDVPLPSLKMKHTSEKPTFNDLHRIRAKAKQAIDAYYHHLRQAEIRNAWEHWDRLYADEVLPKKLLANFRKVYATYSPHREEEAFVVCPWKPGPFLFLRHIQKPPLFSIPKSPDIAITGSPRQKSGGQVIQPRKTLSLQQSMSRAAPSFRQTPSPLSKPISSLADTCVDSKSSHSKL